MQTAGTSVYKHGEMVLERFKELEDALDADSLDSLTAWRLPSWVTEHKNYLRDHLNQEHADTMYDYLLFHDMGKPYCRLVDAEGRVHFPDHAKVSEQAILTCARNHDYGSRSAQSYLAEIDHIGSATYAGMDMDAHLLKQDGVAEFASRYQAPVLLLAALSEIHANASMFGGIESTSFKIKWKQLSKMGGRVMEAIAANKIRTQA